MLMIRLQRVGRTNHAEFRIIVTEHARSAKTGDYVEVIGHYNPHTDKISIDADKVQTWISKGAKASPTVHNLLITAGVLKGKKINVLPKKTPPVKEGAIQEPKESPTETTSTETTA